MTDQLKLIVDESIAPCIVDDLKSLLRHAKDEENAHVKHVHTFYEEVGLDNQGTWDEVWVPKLAEGEWAVLAGDRGKTPGKGAKLPSLCVKYGLTHFLLSPVVHERQKFKKLMTILSVWHEIIAIMRDQKGSRYMLEPLSSAPETCGRGKLVRKEIPLFEPPPKGLLFRK